MQGLVELAPMARSGMQPWSQHCNAKENGTRVACEGMEQRDTVDYNGENKRAEIGRHRHRESL